MSPCSMIFTPAFTEADSLIPSICRSNDSGRSLNSPKPRSTAIPGCIDPRLSQSGYGPHIGVSRAGAQIPPVDAPYKPISVRYFSREHDPEQQLGDTRALRIGGDPREYPTICLDDLARTGIILIAGDEHPGQAGDALDLGKQQPEGMACVTAPLFPGYHGIADMAGHVGRQILGAGDVSHVNGATKSAVPHPEGP